MTADTGGAAGGLAQSIRSITAETGTMGVDAAGTALGAVALDAGITAGMTGLAGVEVTPGLPGMVKVPGVHARRDPTVEVTVVAAIQGPLTPVVGVDRLDIAVEAQGEDPTVGRTGRPTVPSGIAAESTVAGIAGGRFVASGAEPGIGSSDERMADPEITTMDIGQPPTELAHLHSRSLYMTVQAVVLLMAVGTVYFPGFREGTVGKTPKRAVSVAQSRQSDLVGKFLIVALSTGPALRHDGGAVRQMTGGAG